MSHKNILRKAHNRSVHLQEAQGIQRKQEVQQQMSKNIVDAYQTAARVTLPKILKEDCSPAKALMLIASRGYCISRGVQDINSLEASQACQLVLRLWHDGLFTPPENYPYSLEQTMKAIEVQIEQDTPEVTIEIPDSVEEVQVEVIEPSQEVQEK